MRLIALILSCRHCVEQGCTHPFALQPRKRKRAEGVGEREPEREQEQELGAGIGALEVPTLPHTLTFEPNLLCCRIYLEEMQQMATSHERHPPSLPNPLVVS